MKWKIFNGQVRLYGKKDLKRWPIEWGFIRDGIDSGFPSCCIVYYKVRLFFMYLWQILFDNYGPFCNNRETKVFKTDEEYNAWKNSLEAKRHPGHITCWCHKVVYALKQTPTEWYVCKDCKWSQLKNPICTRCK